MLICVLPGLMGVPLIYFMLPESVHYLLVKVPTHTMRQERETCWMSAGKMIGYQRSRFRSGYP